jgi:hypothetical protein
MSRGIIKILFIPLVSRDHDLESRRDFYLL